MGQILPQETAKGYSPPSVRQFSVFLENKVGRLLDLVRVFDDAPDVHLCGLSVLESSDHAVVRLIPNNGDTALGLLRDHGVAFSVLELLVVELHEGQTISGLCLCLLGAELNIRFAYPLFLSIDGAPEIAIAVDDHVLAGQILRKKGFRLLGEHDLA